MSLSGERISILSPEFQLKTIPSLDSRMRGNDKNPEPFPSHRNSVRRSVLPVLKELHSRHARDIGHPVKNHSFT